MDVERTPDERFAGLSSWPYEPRYATVGEGLRMHYIDQGPPDVPVVLLAHGEPSCGHLYRKMIPVSLFHTRVPGAQGRRHVTVPEAGHFLQEQQPDLLVDAILSLG